MVFYRHVRHVLRRRWDDMVHGVGEYLIDHREVDEGIIQIFLWVMIGTTIAYSVFREYMIP